MPNSVRQHLVYFCVIFLSGQTAAHGSENLKLLGSLLGSSHSDLNSHSTVGGVQLEARYHDILVSNLGYRLAGVARVESGQSISTTTNAYAPENEFQLLDAHLFIAPQLGPTALDFRAGILDQSRWVTQLGYKKTGFLGLREGVSLPVDTDFQTTLSLNTEQSLPTEIGHQKFPTQQENRSMHLVEELVGRHKNADGFVIEGAIQHFYFSELSSQSANDSRFLGNTVVGLGPDSAIQVYRYQGFGYHLGTELPLTRRVHTQAGLSFSNNWKALTGANQAWLASISCSWAPTAFYELIPFFERFNFEADSYPAIFTASQYGFRNRAGNRVGIRVAFGQPRSIEVLAAYTNAKTLSENSNQYQGDFQYFEIGVTKSYEFF